jgi:hypothetical protein
MLFIAVTDRPHLVFDRAPASALCGERVSMAELFAYEPGSDFGQHHLDCGECLKRARKDGGK